MPSADKTGYKSSNPVPFLLVSVILHAIFIYILLIYFYDKTPQQDYSPEPLAITLLPSVATKLNKQNNPVPKVLTEPIVNKQIEDKYNLGKKTIS